MRTQCNAVCKGVQQRIWGALSAFGGGGNAAEGKGRLKSWTLRDGLSEGVMGQGLAAPPPPPHPLPPPLVPQRNGRTEAPGSGIRPLCPPMAPSQAPRAPCGRWGGI